MIRVYMRKVDTMEDVPTSENVLRPETEVHIRVTLTTPNIGAEPFIGISFKNVPETVISETTVPFSQMRQIMKFHNLKNWNEVKTHIEDKYNAYYGSMFFRE